MLKSQMVVSVTEGTKGNRARKEIGKVEIYTPSLTEIAKIIVDAKETGKDEKDGLPVYETQEANWVFSAIHNAVKMAARNKIDVAGNVVRMKDGLTIADNMADLTEEGQRGGNGEGLAIVREAKAAFSDWVATLGKSETTAAFITTMFSNRAALATQPAHVKEKMSTYVIDFAAQLTDEQMERFTRPLEAVQASCAVVANVEDAKDF